MANSDFIKIANELAEIAKELEEVIEKRASSQPHDYMHGKAQEEQTKEFYEELNDVSESDLPWDTSGVKGAEKGAEKKAGWNTHDYMHGISAEEQNKHNAEENRKAQVPYAEAVKEAEKTYGDQSKNETYYHLTKDASDRSKALLAEATNLLKIAAWLEERGL